MIEGQEIDQQPDQSDHAPPAKRGRGAPRGNKNAAGAGIYAVANYIPAKYQAALSAGLNRMRGVLESLVLAARGVESVDDLSPVDRFTVQTCCKWERHGALCAAWLRDHANEMTVDQRLSYSREVARASTERDRQIRLLKLDGSPDWRDIFSGSPAAITDVPPLHPPDPTTAPAAAMASNPVPEP